MFDKQRVHAHKNVVKPTGLWKLFTPPIPSKEVPICLEKYGIFKMKYIFISNNIFKNNLPYFQFSVT